MFRIIAWALTALYLLTVGMWPAAAAPFELAFTGLGTVLATVPGPILLLAAVVVWLKRKPTPAKTTA
jgi:hypothetical protein